MHRCRPNNIVSFIQLLFVTNLDLYSIFLIPLFSFILRLSKVFWVAVPASSIKEVNDNVDALLSGNTYKHTLS